MGEMRRANRILMRSPFGRPRHRWKDNINMDLQEVEGAWAGLIWLRIGTDYGLL
jgi:hypothetical protein